MVEDPKSRKLEVPAEEDGARLDRLVAVLAGVSRKEARQMIGSGRVWIKNRQAKILSKRFKAGTILEFRDGGESISAKAPSTNQSKRELDVIYLDHEMIVVNKPSGLLTEHDRFGSPSLESVVPAWLDAQGHNNKIWLVHRLDAVTSGVVVLARSQRAVKRLNAVFRERQAEKTYLALVAQDFSEPVRVDAPLGRLKGTRHGVKPDGKPAQTDFKPIVTRADGALVMALPLTGRTHQIRVHLAHLDRSIVGDRLYGGSMYLGDSGEIVVPRTMLHAYRLTVPHPRGGALTTFEAPVPPDMVTLMQQMNLDYQEHLNKA